MYFLSVSYMLVLLSQWSGQLCYNIVVLTTALVTKYNENDKKYV